MRAWPSTGEVEVLSPSVTTSVAAMQFHRRQSRFPDGFGTLTRRGRTRARVSECPAFTKPREFRSWEIPEVLLEIHAAIER